MRRLVDRLNVLRRSRQSMPLEHCDFSMINEAEPTRCPRAATANLMDIFSQGSVFVISVKHLRAWKLYSSGQVKTGMRISVRSQKLVIGFPKKC